MGEGIRGLEVERISGDEKWGKIVEKSEKCVKNGALFIFYLHKSRKMINFARLLKTQHYHEIFYTSFKSIFFSISNRFFYALRRECVGCGCSYISYI